MAVPTNAPRASRHPKSDSLWRPAQTHAKGYQEKPRSRLPLSGFSGVRQARGRVTGLDETESSEPRVVRRPLASAVAVSRCPRAGALLDRPKRRCRPAGPELPLTQAKETSRRWQRARGCRRSLPAAPVDQRSRRMPASGRHERVRRIDLRLTLDAEVLQDRHKRLAEASECLL